MKLLEFIDTNDIAPGYYNPSQDDINRRKISDTRKPKLTLRGLNRLKKMQALKQLEALKREDLLTIMYGETSDGGGMGVGGMGGGMF